MSAEPSPKRTDAHRREDRRRQWTVRKERQAARRRAGVECYLVVLHTRSLIRRLHEAGRAISEKPSRADVEAALEQWLVESIEE